MKARKTISCSTRKVLPCLLLSMMALTACGPGEAKSLDRLTPLELPYESASNDLHAATINSLVSTDAYGRSFGEGNVSESDRQVGMFYFVWQGEHISNIYNVTELEKTNPTELWNLDSTVLPRDEFYYFSEPLYGYYCSDDPFVLMRHVELLTMSGIDYLCLDLTNYSLYERNITALLETLLTCQQQGWNVPKVTAILNGTSAEANHLSRIQQFCRDFYQNPRYDSLWFRDEITGLPSAIIDRQTTYAGVNYYTALPSYIKDMVTFRNVRWPFDGGETVYDDVSWMDWCYPQRVYHNSNGNLMSVSVAQHTGNEYGTGGSFGLSVNPLTKDDPRYNGNKGRGYDEATKKNISERAFEGLNLENQWNNALRSEENIDEVFVTGWNEWIAYKLATSVVRSQNVPDDPDHIADFCDTCDEEYSRDIEMTKDGYGDNFYLQNMRLTRQFKARNHAKYYGSYATKDLKNLSWQNARTYLDFTGDAMNRHFLRADRQNGVYYDNNTARNDIASTKVCHDDTNLYLQITAKDPIVIDQDKNNNLNVLLSVEGSTAPNWEGYQFILNRTPVGEGETTTSLEAVSKDGSFMFTSLDACPAYREGNVLSVQIPLASLGITSLDFTLDFKVADGMSEPSNIMNYYVDGDSAPIGRLNYRYHSLSHE